MPPAFGDDGNLNSQPPAVDLPAEAAENCLIFISGGEKFPDTVDRCTNRFLAGGIGKAQKALAEFSKTGAGDRCDPRLLEQLPLQGAGVAASPGDIGEGIEGAPRSRAAYPGQPVQRCDDHFAPLSKSRDHAADWLARSGKGRDPGELRGGVDTGMAIDRQP